MIELSYRLYHLIATVRCQLSVEGFDGPPPWRLPWLTASEIDGLRLRCMVVVWSGLHIEDVWLCTADPPPRRLHIQLDGRRAPGSYTHRDLWPSVLSLRLKLKREFLLRVFTAQDITGFGVSVIAQFDAIGGPCAAAVPI